jgi:hypothetical protein
MRHRLSGAIFPQARVRPDRPARVTTAVDDDFQIEFVCVMLLVVFEQLGQAVHFREGVE